MVLRTVRRLGLLAAAVAALLFVRDALVTLPQGAPFVGTPFDELVRWFGLGSLVAVDTTLTAPSWAANLLVFPAWGLAELLALVGLVPSAVNAPITGTGKFGSRLVRLIRACGLVILVGVGLGLIAALVGGPTWALESLADVINVVASVLGETPPFVPVSSGGEDRQGSGLASVLDALVRLPTAAVLAVAGTLLLFLARAAQAFMRTTGFSADDGSTNDALRAKRSSPATKVDETMPARTLALAIRRCRAALIGAAVFSGVINLLMLTGSLFMLEVYDRVLPGRSVPTLVVLAVLAMFLFFVQGILDAVRSRMLLRIGMALDESVSPHVYDAMARLPLEARESLNRPVQTFPRSQVDRLQPSRDLDAVRNFFSGMGPSALFDLPWMPLYMVVIFAFHPWLGYTAIGGAVVLVLLTLVAELATRRPTRAATGHFAHRHTLAEATRRNAEALAAMGMRPHLGRLWANANRSLIETLRLSGDVASGFGAMTKTLRMILQSAVLGVGAYLVLQQQATAGIIIAASILSARALAPADLAIANWRGFASARESWRRLEVLFESLPNYPEPLELPAPTTQLSVEGVAAQPPGLDSLVLADVSFRLAAGDALGVIGPSASGKSSLARLLVGVWQPVRGRISLDGAALAQWPPASLGRHLGYVPQDVELFEGSIAENIGRFDPNISSEEILAAATAACAHEMIVRLPKGYATAIGERGHGLSAGQRQRVALARALLRDPFLVVLDEPSSNLDSEGDLALEQAVRNVRARGGIVIIIAHRPSALGAVDLLLAMQAGRAVAFGRKEDVLQRVLRPASAGTPPFKVISAHKTGPDGRGAT